MTTTRIHWADLPESVHRAVAERLGDPAFAVETVTAGFNSEIAVKITTARGSAFVKGLRLDHPRAWTQRREAEIGRYLCGIAPALLWSLDIDGWGLVAFEYIEGRPAHYKEGGDLELMVDTLTRIGEVPRPPIELRLAEQRWAAYVDDPGAVSRFAGDSLLHTDLNNENVLIRGDRALLVDWAWATRGASWIDPALWVIWLIAVGDHSPAAAEAWAALIPAWKTAQPGDLDAFAGAQARMWAEIAGDDPDPWTANLHRAAGLWHRHRQGRRRG